MGKLILQPKVAPRAGAWVETKMNVPEDKAQASHPVRVRGLKHDAVIDFELQNWVAPRAGAWVETGVVRSD